MAGVLRCSLAIVVQMQTTVTPHVTSKQLPLFAFAVTCRTTDRGLESRTRRSESGGVSTMTIFYDTHLYLLRIRIGQVA